MNKLGVLLLWLMLGCAANKTPLPDFKTGAVVNTPPGCEALRKARADADC